VHRLKTRIQFQAVLAGGKVAATAHFVLHRCVLNGGTCGPGQPSIGLQSKAPLFSPPDVWLGAMVPKRWAKRAVTRNFIKRQIYNVSSEFESVLPVAAHVVRLRRGFDRSRFVSASSDALKTAVRGELLQLFSNATQVVTTVKSSGAPR
jgi:ribonuclease P protein component